MMTLKVKSIVIAISCNILFSCMHNKNIEKVSNKQKIKYECILFDFDKRRNKVER